MLSMTTRTTSRWLTIVAVLLLACVTWLWLTRGDVAQSNVTKPPVTITAGSAQQNADHTAPSVPAHIARGADASQRLVAQNAYLSAADRAMDRYRCVDTEDRSCKYNSIAASSEAEALWLAQHGYPSQADIEAYPSLSVMELDERAARDPAFAALRARRRIEDGELGAGLSQLIGLVKRGNLYALYEMSRAYQGKDVYDSAAYLRLAYLFGDRRAAAELYTQFSDIDIPMLNVIDERAASLRVTMFPGVLIQPRPFE